MSGDIFKCYDLCLVGRDLGCHLQCTGPLPTAKNYLIHYVNSADVKELCSTGKPLRTMTGHRKEI